VLRGVYGAPIANFMGRVGQLRANVEMSALPDFTETVVTRKINDVLDYAMAGDADGGKIVVIIGPARRGKTKSAKQWSYKNRGHSVFVDCPATGGQLALLREIARKCNIDRAANVTKLAPRIIDAFHRKRMLILDEVSRIVPLTDRSRPVAMEFVRRLHDEKGCPVALLVTPQTWMEIEHGALRLYFEQLIGRVDLIVQIQPDVRADEVRAICTDACGGRPDAKMIEEARKSAAEKGRLGTLFNDLRKAGKIATSKKEKLNGEHMRIARLHRHQLGVWPKDEVAP
jgi:DNA transposition AAA+ family ATPase